MDERMVVVSQKLLYLRDAFREVEHQIDDLTSRPSQSALDQAGWYAKEVITAAQALWDELLAVEIRQCKICGEGLRQEEDAVCGWHWLE